MDGFPAITATTVVPSSPQVRLRVYHTDRSIDSLYVYSNVNTWVVPPKGHYFQLELVRDEGAPDFAQKRVIVPYDFNPETNKFIYPSVNRETSIAYTKFYVHEALRQLTGSIEDFAGVYAVASMYSIGTDFYNYYKVVRGFDDPRTVRLDLPDYSNIEGARGVFGSVYRDTLYNPVFAAFKP